MDGVGCLHVRFRLFAAGMLLPCSEDADADLSIAPGVPGAVLCTGQPTGGKDQL